MALRPTLTGGLPLSRNPAEPLRRLSRIDSTGYVACGKRLMLFVSPPRRNKHGVQTENCQSPPDRFFLPLFSSSDARIWKGDLPRTKQPKIRQKIDVRRCRISVVVSETSAGSGQTLRPLKSWRLRTGSRSVNGPGARSRLMQRTNISCLASRSSAWWRIRHSGTSGRRGEPRCPWASGEAGRRWAVFADLHCG